MSLAAALTVEARAQAPTPAGTPSSTQGTDVFANNSSNTQVYEDQFSNNCDKTNHSSLAMDSPDPARCFERPAAQNGQCSPIGGMDSKLAGQKGNVCFYCQGAAMPGKEIVIPSTGGIGFGTPSYDWICTANPSDGCYLSCFGNLPSPTLPPGASVETEKADNGSPVYTIKDSNDPCQSYPNGPSMCSYPAGTPLPPGCTCSKQPQKLLGYLSNAPDPCYPAGPKNYNACDYPNVTRPPGCDCSKTPGPQSGMQTKPQPSTPSTSQPPNEGQYLQGLVDGIKTCLQNLQATWTGLAAGAGYFAQLDFVHAAQLWGVQPGQSALLSAAGAQLQNLYDEMTTPQVGSKVTPYDQGVAGGKRLCQYLLIPAAKTATQAALKGAVNKIAGAVGGNSGSSSSNSTPQLTGPGGNPPQLPGGTGDSPPKIPGSTSSGSSPPQLPSAPGGAPPTPVAPAGGDDLPATVPPSNDSGNAAATQGGGNGLTPSTPLWGGPLQLDLDRDAKSLGGKYVKLPDGRVIQLGVPLGTGGFADVYKYGDLAIKFSKNEGTYGYGPDSLAGQNLGADRLQGTGVLTPKVYEYQAGGNGLPASLVTGDANTEFPGFKEITPKEFQAMPAAEQGEVLKAMTGLTNAIAGKGYVLGDPNPANIRFKPVTGGGYQAMLLDTDMVMTPAEIQAAAAQPGASPEALVRSGVVKWGLELAGQQDFNLNNTNAQALTDVLNQGRVNRLMNVTPATSAAVNEPSDTVVP